MKHYRILSSFILVIVIAAAVTCLVSKPQFSELQNWNIEALASSETYVLDECYFGYDDSHGMTQLLQFCHDTSSPNVIHDCEIPTYKVPTTLGKCVLYVH